MADFHKSLDAALARQHTAEKDAPRLIPVPDVTCANCGRGVAWRVGVGRYVISHDDGDDVCSRACIRLADEDREAASLAYRRADEAFRQSRVTSPGAGRVEGADR